MLMLAVAIAISMRKGEPSYEGRLLGDWIIVGGMSNFPEVEAKSVEAIRAIGDRGVPHLIRWMSYEEPHWHAVLKDTTSHIGVHVFENRSSHLRDFTVWSFRALGSNAVSAIPELTTLLNGPEGTPGDLAAAALSQMGEPGVQPLLAAITSTNLHAKRRAAGTAIGLGANAGPLLPHLFKAIDDPDVMTAVNAVNSILQLKVDSAQLVQRLRAMLDHREMKRRKMAIVWLGRTGAEAQAAVSALEVVVAGTNATLSSAAAIAIQRIQQAASASTIPKL